MNITTVFENESENNNKQLQISYYIFKVPVESSEHNSYIIKHCLLVMLEKWKHAVNNDKIFGVLHTNLLKVFFCLC